jgi:UTP--glucose-1-phosphate uridylyltransferase
MKLQSRHKPIEWEKIKPPPGDMIKRMSELPPCPPGNGTQFGAVGISINRYFSEKAQELLKKLAVVKLNGGLGTTMGCTGPKVRRIGSLLFLCAYFALCSFAPFACT